MLKSVNQLGRQNGPLLAGAALLVLSACVHVPRPGAEGVSSNNQTAMLYVPGQNGRSGTILPYSIVPNVAGDRDANPSAKQLSGNGKDITDGKGQVLKGGYPSWSSTAVALCKSLPCKTPVRAIPWEQKVALITASPSVVIGAVIALLKSGSSVNESSIRATLGDSAFSEKGSGVVTSVVSEPYSCKNGDDSVPSDLLREACGNHLAVEEVNVSGVPGSFQTGKLSPLPGSSDRRFWYGLDALQRDVQSAGLKLVDVTNPYNIAWNGHMPRMKREYQIGPSSGRLAVAVTGTSSDDVLTLTIYQSLGD